MKDRLLIGLCVALSLFACVAHLGEPASAQLSLPAFYPFQPNTRISSTEMNAVFSNIASNALNRTGGTMTGNLLFSLDNTLDIGASGATRARDFFLGRNALIGGTLGVTGTATLPTIAGATSATGAWTFTAGPVISHATSALLYWYESGAASNAKYWRAIASSGGFSLQTVNDALDTAANILTISRTGATPVEASFAIPAEVPRITATGVATATANDTTITLADGTSMVRVTAVSGANTIQGFTGGEQGRLLWVCGVAIGFTISEEDAAATAANRIASLAGETITIIDNNCAMLIYDGTTSRWRLVGDGMP